MAHYLSAVPKESQVKTVLTFHNVASQQFDSIYKVIHAPVPKFRAWLFSRQMRAWESRCLKIMNRCVTVSESDRQLLLDDTPGKLIEIVPNGVDTQKNRPLPRGDLQPSLLLLGLMSYAPYADSAQYFCEQILPILRQSVPDLRVYIVGANPPEKVRRLHGEGVTVTGLVPEVAPYYLKSTLSIVPLRAGGGTRLKILESMALGRPVVSTSLGCEGLKVEHGEHLLIADTPQDFAAGVLRLLEDPELYDKLAVNARKRVEEQYDWDSIARRMLEIYERLGEQ